MDSLRIKLAFKKFNVVFHSNCNCSLNSRKDTTDRNSKEQNIDSMDIDTDNFGQTVL